MRERQRDTKRDTERHRERGGAGGGCSVTRLNGRRVPARAAPVAAEEDAAWGLVFLLEKAWRVGLEYPSHSHIEDSKQLR